MKRGTNADQILFDIEKTEKELKSLQIELDNCTDEEETVYLLDIINQVKRKLYRLKSM